MTANDSNPHQQQRPPALGMTMTEYREYLEELL